MITEKYIIEKAEFIGNIVLCIGKYLILPWGVQMAFFRYMAVDYLELFYALIVVYFIWKLHYVLAHPPQSVVFQEPKEEVPLK